MTGYVVKRQYLSNRPKTFYGTLSEEVRERLVKYGVTNEEEFTEFEGEVGGMEENTEFYSFDGVNTTSQNTFSESHSMSFFLS